MPIYPIQRPFTDDARPAQGNRQNIAPKAEERNARSVGEFPFQGRFAMRRAMQPPSPGDALLVLAIASIVFLIEIGIFILLVML